ncbi:MAG TPA: ribosome recycling factor [Bacillota bacterium]
MVKDVLKETEDKMKRTAELFRKELAGLRAGRATPALLERVLVDYYGTPTPVNQMANISVPEPRLLVIQPWDKGQVPVIERAILKSDLGLTPKSDAGLIRLVIPPLNEERRRDLVKQINRKAEEQRVALRNVRRDANDFLKDLEKEDEITEDEHRRGQEEVQKLTDKYIAEVDSIIRAKEKEIMEV